MKYFLLFVVIIALFGTLVAQTTPCPNRPGGAGGAGGAGGRGPRGAPPTDSSGRPLPRPTDASGRPVPPPSRPPTTASG